MCCGGFWIRYYSEIWNEQDTNTRFHVRKRSQNTMVPFSDSSDSPGCARWSLFLRHFSLSQRPRWNFGTCWSPCSWICQMVAYLKLLNIYIELELWRWIFKDESWVILVLNLKQITKKYMDQSIFSWYASGHPEFTTARLCPHSCECWASIREAWEYGFSKASALCLVLNPLNPALQNWDTLPKTNSSPLKMDGWNINFPWGPVYFQRPSDPFRESSTSFQTLLNLGPNRWRLNS